MTDRVPGARLVALVCTAQIFVQIGAGVIIGVVSIVWSIAKERTNRSTAVTLATAPPVAVEIARNLICTAARWQKRCAR